MLAAKPDVIMLDEPFSALDNYLKTWLEREIMDVLDSYDKPVLFVSHDRNEVYRLTDRIAVMENGRIVDVQSKRELFGNPKTLAATLLTGCKNITRLAMADDGSYQALDWGVRLKKERGTEWTDKMQEKQNVQVLRKYRYAGFGVLFGEHAAEMKQAGLSNVNISLDTLDGVRFQEITGFPYLDNVLNAVKQALKQGIHVKINCVPQLLRYVQSHKAYSRGQIKALSAL